MLGQDNFSRTGEEEADRLIGEAFHLRLRQRSNAAAVAGRKKSRAGLIALVDDAAGLAEATICQASSFEPDCQAGCVWCCYQRVTATPAEIFRIVEYLRDTLLPEELDAVHRRIAQMDDQLRGADAQTRLQARQPCPLLIEGSCSVYAVRPLTCRGYTSADARVCQAKLEHPERSTRIDADPIRYLYCQGVLNGLNDGLAENGLEAGMVELVAGLRIALDDPKRFKRWLNGERLFQEAKVEMKPLRPA